MKLGIAFSGGGAHGAWEAGVIKRLDEAGLAFDRAWGFSAGSLNAAAYATGIVEDGSKVWTTLDKERVMVLSPRHWPHALFSPEPVRAILSRWFDEERAKTTLRCSLHIVAYDVERKAPVGGAYERGGAWDAPLVDFLLASCTNPTVHPPVRTHVRGEPRVLVDGGVPGEQPPDLSPLADCDDIIIVSVVNDTEPVGWALNPLRSLNQKVKGILRYQMLRTAKTVQGPRLHWITPSKPLDWLFLNFNGEKCRAAFDQGLQDAAGFLKRFRISGHTRN